MDPEVTTNKLWWAVPAAVILILILLVMLFGTTPDMMPHPGSTVDASDNGVRAAYLLLEGLGYDVAVSKRIADGRLRWLVFPNRGERDLPLLDDWVRAGGVLLLASDKSEFVEKLQLPGAVNDDGGAAPIVLSVNGEELRLDAGSKLVAPRGQPASTWPEGANEPLVSVFRRGRGEIWLVRRPEFLLNHNLRAGDNAVILCRLAEAMGQKQRILFDEYFHGMRERPSPTELLLQPPVLYVTLQGLLLLALAMWRFQPRFGPFREPAPVRRRSKEEFLDAVANLLEQKRAFAECHRSVRDALARELENALGVSAGMPPDQLAALAAARAPGLHADQLAEALSRDLPANAGAVRFLQAVNHLEQLRSEFFHERKHR